MKRILFVDDDPNILNGLRDLLRKQRKAWDMVFALGGPAAIVELERGPFDVVVSDMRMPTVDGAALLAHVKACHPGAARIVLSGHAEREAVVRALPVAHQFLSKPCDVGLLRVVIERACQLQRTLQDDNIRAVVGRLDRLPSTPRAYWELTQTAARPDVAIAELVAIVEQDPALAVKILQLVNSSYFGVAKQMSSIEQAVVYIGTDLLRALALTVHAFDTLKAPPIEGFSLEDIQQRSLLAARVGKKLATDRAHAAEVFTAALVRDVGKVALAIGSPQRYEQVLRAVRTTGGPTHVVERELLGITHAEVGAFLLGVWGLPLSIVEAVAYHHTPNVVTEGPTATLALVHIGDSLSEAVHGRATSEPTLDLAFIERAGYGELVAAWQATAAEMSGSVVQGR